jgi:hypothetical protein
MLVKIDEEIQVNLEELIEKRIKENVDDEFKSYDFEDAYDTIIREEIKGEILSKKHNDKIESSIVDEVKVVTIDEIKRILSEISLRDMVNDICKNIITQKLIETLDIETIIKKLK